MSAGAGMLWCLALLFASGLWLLGWVLLLQDAARTAVDIFTALRTGRAPRATTPAEWEMLAAAVVLIQIGAAAAFILLKMKGP